MKLASWTAAAFALTAVFSTASAAEAADVKLWRLDCGTIKVNNLDLFSDTFAYVGQKRTLTDSCYLIAHRPDYLLWDTGLPAGLKGAPTDDKAPLSPTLTKTLAEQLETLGVKPEQIAQVGISHYHFDHVGQAAEFPKAKLLIGRADLEALKIEPAPFGADPSLLAPWLKDGGAVGRKFDFLCQEFNREANTLCSKSADSELTAIGLELKASIDQLREQVQNIE